MKLSSPIRLCMVLGVLAYLAVQSLGMHFHRTVGTPEGGTHAHAHAHAGEHGVHEADSPALPKLWGHDFGSHHAATDIETAATAGATIGHFDVLVLPPVLFVVLWLLVAQGRDVQLPLRWPRTLIPRRLPLYLLRPPANAPPSRLLKV